MSSTVNCESKIHNLFKNMILSPATESDDLALSWLEKHQKEFYGFVDGCWLTKEKVEKDAILELECHKVCDTFSEKHLCDVFTSTDGKLLEEVLDYSSGSTATAFKTWSSFEAARILFNIAQSIEKNQQLFAIMEAISTGKHLYKAKEEINNLIQSFRYYAGCALQFISSPSHKWMNVGRVCVIAEKYNNPSLALSLRICSALAAGNSVVLLTDVKSSLSSFLLAEICFEAGLPAGVLNVIPIVQEKLKTLGDTSYFSKLVFTGSLAKSMIFSKICSESRQACEFLIPRRPVVIVYENADLYSAANGVLESMCFHDTRSESGGCKVMVQESIYEKFTEVLTKRFWKVQVGTNFSKTDLSCLVSDEQKKVISDLVKEGVKHNGKLASVPFVKTWNHATRSPVLFTDLKTCSRLMQEELGGPTVVTVRFRTVKESISMFNSDNKGSPVSVWSEKHAVALEVASKLKTGVIWINTQNVIDAGCAFTGVYSSGNSVEGGSDAFFSHLSIVPEASSVNTDSIFKLLQSPPKLQESTTSIIEKNCDNKIECKLYIGGKWKPFSNAVKLDSNIFISKGAESDLDNAISSAVAAQSKWDALTDSQKRKVFIDIVEKLKKNKKEYISVLQKVSGSSVDDCVKEVSDTIGILYYWIMQITKFSEPVQEIKKNFMVLQSRCPRGVIGIECPDKNPLLSFVSLVIPAVMSGNAVVALASARYPVLALKMCEIFESAKVPDGVINVIWGDNSRLVPILCKHTDVNAVWYSDSENVLKFCNVTQRQICFNGIWNSVHEAVSRKFAMESTYPKSIFLPVGDIFAN